MNVGFNFKKVRTGTFVYPMVFSFFLFAHSFRAFSSETASVYYTVFKLSTITRMSPSGLNFILVILSALGILGVSILVFLKKLRKVNNELEKRNNEIKKINTAREKLKEELANQKAGIAKELSVSEKFYGLLFESANDAISFYDKDWNLKFANGAFYSSIGLDQEKYDPATLKFIIHPEDHDYVQSRADALNKNELYEKELRLKHKQGHYINFLTKTIAVRNDDGEVIGALTISRDITSLKQVNEELLKAKGEAEISNKLKTSFLANISHEIRTPLNSVVGFANLLLPDDLSREAKEEYIEHINHNSDKLLQIIGDIIDLSRLESSQIEINYEGASLNEIINEVIEEARQSIKRNEKSIILTVKNQFEDYGDLIFTDRIWLKRVLNHLLDNAVKFTLEGSVELSYYKENDNVLFKIKDTGIGINKENLGLIFEEFSQESEGHHRPFEGLGIGLTLAREVIGRMRGKIFVQSEKGFGSEFSFTIPYRPAGSRKIKIPGVEQFLNAPDWSLNRCLIVDDNKDVLIYLKRILHTTGIDIITAKSGFEAIELVKSTPDIDVVLLDMQMPVMNGIEATREIRNIRKDLPIIAQTAFIFEDDKDIILEAGCDACLIKPIRKEHLLTVMASFIKINRKTFS
jgi:PAS domain S-box-containing protein